jgi:hypothetical protein
VLIGPGADRRAKLLIHLAEGGQLWAPIHIERLVERLQLAADSPDAGQHPIAPPLLQEDQENMPRSCIICGNRAGSREHTFPAVLGGRRTNKGIYCGAHNNGFSPLAKIIGDQLKAINALLAVRPDHRDRANPMQYTSPEGEDLVIFDGAVRSAAAGAPPGQRGHHVQLRLGGPEGLRAIAYIALTFFAHHFRDHARHGGLDALKAFVQGNGENVFVWWERPDRLAMLPPNPFAFGHTIVVMTSAATKEATAFISLFQSLDFGVHLGRLSGLADASVIVFIDPQAESPPHDIQEHRHNAVLLPLVTPDPMHAHLEKNVRERTAEHALQELLRRIEQWRFAKDMEPARARLNAARGLGAQALMAEIIAVVEENTSRVYRLIRHVGDGLTAKEQRNPIMQPVLRHIEGVMARDPTRSDRLTPAAEEFTKQCMLALASHLAQRLAQRDITIDDLWDFFSSGPGAGIVGDLMFKPFR